MSKRNRKPYKYQELRHSADGLVSFGLGVLTLVLLIGEAVFTIRTRGQAGGMVGYMGLAALLFSAVGMFFAVISWKDEESMDTFKRVGTMMNIVLLVVNVCIILLGVLFG